MTTNSNHPAIQGGEQDEREAFEADYAKSWNAAYGNTTNYTAADVAALREGDGYGADAGYLIGRWDGWQARARMAAPAAGDARCEEDATSRFMRDVYAELRRAREKFPGDRIMTIALAEEFGELAKAMLDESGAHVWKEAVQTAVMAARVAIDGDSSVDEWRAAKGLDNHRSGGGPTQQRQEG